MYNTRRTFLKTSSAFMLAAPLAACSAPSQNAASSDNRRLMINGNIVIPFDSDGPLPDDIKQQIRASGLAAGKVSIGGAGGSYEDVHEALDFYDAEIERNNDIYMPIRHAADIQTALDTSRFGIIKSFEAATMFDGNPTRIGEFASRDVKVMQLGYNNHSPFGAGVMSSSGDLGLTELGREAIAEMEAHGVLLDLSHAHEETMAGAIDASRKPVAVTHSGCSAVHMHQRNKSDHILKRVADTGGVVGIYELSYLTPDLTQTPLSAYLKHLSHAIDICGEDHVGIGSDALLLEFDTGPESVAQWNEINRARKEAGIAAPGEGPMPFVVGLNGPQRMTVIADELAKLGLRAAAIEKIMGGNFLRVFRDSWSA